MTDTLFVHKYDKDGKSAEQGQSAVKAFLELCNKHSIMYEKCSRKEDVTHKDYNVWFPTTTVKLPAGKRKVDIKSTKSIRRGKAAAEDVVCLEVHGTKIKDLGWILDNEDDNIIAFQIKSKNIFYLIEIRELKSYIFKLRDEKIISLDTEAKVKHNRKDDYEIFEIYRRDFPDKIREKFLYVPLAHLLANVKYFILG